MKKTLYKLFLLTICAIMISAIMISCKSREKEINLSEEDVYKITKEMNKSEIEDLLGEPVENIGSGLYINAYHVGDSVVLISFNSQDKLINAVLQKSDGTEEDIIK